MTTTTRPKDLKAKLTPAPRTTFLSLPRDLRQAVILDALNQSYTFTWLTMMILHDTPSLPGHDCGWWVLHSSLAFEMKEAVEKRIQSWFTTELGP
jgi:hypothetical protein